MRQATGHPHARGGRADEPDVLLADPPDAATPHAAQAGPHRVEMVDERWPKPVMPAGSYAYSMLDRHARLAARLQQNAIMAAASRIRLCRSTRSTWRHIWWI